MLAQAALLEIGRALREIAEIATEQVQLGTSPGELARDRASNALACAQHDCFHCDSPTCVHATRPAGSAERRALHHARHCTMQRHPLRPVCFDIAGSPSDRPLARKAGSLLPGETRLLVVVHAGERDPRARARAADR